MSVTLTLTNEQAEILGYALLMAKRDQKDKLNACEDAARYVSEERRVAYYALRIESFKDRIIRLDAVMYLLPPETV